MMHVLLCFLTKQPIHLKEEKMSVLSKLETARPKSASKNNATTGERSTTRLSNPFTHLHQFTNTRSFGLQLPSSSVASRCRSPPQLISDLITPDQIRSLITDL